MNSLRIQPPDTFNYLITFLGMRDRAHVASTCSEMHARISQVREAVNEFEFNTFPKLPSLQPFFRRAKQLFPDNQPSELSWLLHTFCEFAIQANQNLEQLTFTELLRIAHQEQQKNDLILLDLFPQIANYFPDEFQSEMDPEAIREWLAKADRLSILPLENFQNIFNKAREAGCLSITDAIINSPRFENDIAHPLSLGVKVPWGSVDLLGIHLFKLIFKLDIASLHNHVGVILEIVNSEQFEEIPLDYIGHIFTKISGKGHVGAMEVIINASRFQRIHRHCLERAFFAATSEGQTEAMRTIIHSGRFHCLHIVSIENAFRSAAEKGHVPAMQTIINSDRFQQISRQALEETFRLVGWKRDISPIQTIINSGYFHAIGIGCIEDIFRTAALEGDIGVMKMIVKLGRFQEASRDRIGEIFDAVSGQRPNNNPLRAFYSYRGISEDLAEVIEVIQGCGRFSGIGWDLMKAVQGGNIEKAKRIIRSDRFDEIPNDIIEDVFKAASLSFQNREMLQLLVDSRRFHEISINKVQEAFERVFSLYQGIEEKKSKAQMIVNSGRYHELSGIFLEKSFLQTLSRPDPSKTLSPRFLKQALLAAFLSLFLIKFIDYNKTNITNQ